MTKKESLKKLKHLIETQMLGVIATDMQGIPYASLVAYYSTTDLKNVIFSTSKKTKKFKNIMNNSNISFLIDNRENNPSDINNAITITAFGKAEEIIQNKEYFKELLIKKHPNLIDFINSQDCAILKICVEKYKFVSNFQIVEDIKTNDSSFIDFFSETINDSQ
jgi:nitroimidazol reductase NimA-like FMN-containing flavoprotein (pyridoxamine 5'-phosphate oxidase superfamily)